MTARHRLAALGLALLLAPAAGAQDSPALAELLKEYRALELPLPPASARLVRYENGTAHVVNGERKEHEGLAFEVRPGTSRERPILFRKTDEWRPQWNPHAREVKPDAAAARGADLNPDELIALAVQCHARGWDDLARDLLARLRAAPGRPDPRRQLLGLAWRHWEARLTHPTADRRPAAARLKALVGRDPDLNTRGNRELLKSLDLALAPGTGRPGTVEAEIDALVDYHADTGTLGVFEPGEAYWRIAARGFDAVPALIAHLDDDRLTRSRMMGFNNFRTWHMRVRHVVSDLLEGLAQEELDRGDEGESVGGGWLRRQQGWPVTKAAATAWWEKARKTGEEAHLLAHVLPPEGVWRARGVDPHMLRAIAAKYPGRLPGLYRTVLARRPVIESGGLAEAVARSPLPAKEKLDLLTAAAGNEDYGHRLPALATMKDLDRKRFDALVLAEVESLPPELSGRDGDRASRQARIQVARLATESDAPRLWAALETAARRSSLSQRVDLLAGLGCHRRTDPRPGRIHLLSAFLDDPDVYADSFPEGGYGWIEVRNAVALQLADLLGIEVGAKPDRTPAEWAKVRDEVRAAVKRELDRTK